MKFIYISIYFIFFSINMFCQENAKMTEIKTFHIYKDSSIRGYTSAGSYTHYDDMKAANVSKVIVSIEDRIVFQQILNRAAKRKHYQTKVGSRNLFCEIKYSDTSVLQRILISDVRTAYNFFGKSKGAFILIINLTTMREYKVVEEGDLNWMSNFRKVVQKID